MFGIWLIISSITGKLSRGWSSKHILINPNSSDENIQAAESLWLGETHLHGYKSCFPHSESIITAVTKFAYLLYWDITGAPRHIPGQAFFLCQYRKWVK